MNNFDELDLLATSVRDQKFLARFASRIKPEDFKNEVFGVVWKTVRDLWLEYHELPIFSAVEKHIQAKMSEGYFYDEDVPDIVKAMKSLKNRPVMKGLTYDKVEEWYCSRARAKVAADAQKAVINNDPGAIEKAYAEYKASLSTTEDEADFFDRWVEIAEDSIRLQDGFITTGIRELDNIIGGGYLKGDLFMLWGIDGLGKSWLGQEIGKAATFQKRRVLHLTNEMMKQDVEERYLALFSSVNTRNFSDNVSHIRKLQEDYKNMRGLLKVHFLSLGSTVADIRAILEEAIMDEKPFDLVIIDYVDKVEPARKLGGDDWLRLEHVFEELAELSKMTPDYRLNPAICVITHANSEADGKTIPSGRKAIGRSRMGKSKTVDFSLVMGQDSKWKEQDVVQVTRVKNPRGRGVDAKKITCLLKHIKSDGSFVSIGFEEVDNSVEA